jgi:outer membrane receptor for ferrienterochelin and colicin
MSLRRDTSGAVAIIPFANTVSIDSPPGTGDEQLGSKPDEVARRDIVVTGSRIRGAAPSSPMITMSQEEIQKQGFSTVAEAIRSLPQNFSGGQNPGVINGAAVKNSNNNDYTGASSVNLRGLGADATLTLLNGQRLAYSGNNQSVDISTIPLAALDRIEVLTDGASAMYGADAVAGVANFILKKDYTGVTMTSRLGQATNGGDFQQNYNVVAGSTWQSGGFIATYDYNRNSAIYSSQRDYTNYMPENMLLPKQSANSIVASAHEELGSDATLSITGVYNRRSSLLQGITTAFASNDRNSRVYYVSPSIVFRLPRDWRIVTNGSYSDSRVINTNSVFSLTSGSLTSSSKTCYCNISRSADINTDGSVVRLPGGEFRVALGVGYHRDLFDQTNTSNNSHIRGRRSVAFTYGEALVPIISDSLDVPLISRLLLNGAVRFEHYSDFGSITTPKAGILYTPVGGIDIKASWGRSFKEPALAQVNTATVVTLATPATFGGVGYPSNASVLLAGGGGARRRGQRVAIV